MCLHLVSLAVLWTQCADVAVRTLSGSPIYQEANTHMDMFHNCSAANDDGLFSTSEGGRSPRGVKEAKEESAARRTSRAIMASALDMCSVAETAAALARSVGAAPAFAARVPVPFVLPDKHKSDNLVQRGWSRAAAVRCGRIRVGYKFTW